MIRLIRYEFYKLFCKRSILAVLILFGIINLWKINGEFRSYSYLADGNDSHSWNSVYWHLYDEFSGEITNEKINTLLAIYQPLQDATADMTASTATDNPDTMTGNVYSDRNLLEKYYVQPMKYFYHYSSYVAEVAEKARENVSIYKEQGQTYEARKNSVIYHLYSGRSIEDFAYQEMYNYYLHYDFSGILVLLLCLYGMIGTFVCEKETQMDMLLLTNRNGGRKTIVSKIIAVTIFVIGISLWFSFLDYIGFALSFGTIEGYNLPLYAIENFSTASVNCLLWQYAVLSAVFRAVGVWEICMAFLLVSLFWRNVLIPFVINLGAALCMVIAGAAQSHYSNVWLKVLNPYSMLSNRVLFGRTEFVGFADYPILSYQAAFGCSVLVGLTMAAVMMVCSSQNYHCRERRRNVRLLV